MIISAKCRLVRLCSGEKSDVVEIEKVLKIEDGFIKKNEFHCFLRIYKVYNKSGLLEHIESYSLDYESKKEANEFYFESITSYQNEGYK